jgi:glycerophosphoryl diester phosphodiesterase
MIPAPLKRPLCIAHRGASGYEPENTLRSLRRAVELGAPWIEFDVQVVGEEVVLFHDRTLDRRANRPGLVAELPFAELRSLDVGLGERVPLLSEALELLRGKTAINIELKGRKCAEKVAPILVRVLSNGWKLEDIVVSSFDHHQLLTLRSLLPEIQIGVLVYGYPLSAIETARTLKATSINADISFITAERVKEIQENRFTVNVYTANTVQDITLMSELGVNGIFCDFPDRAL